MGNNVIAKFLIIFATLICMFGNTESLVSLPSSLSETPNIAPRTDDFNYSPSLRAPYKLCSEQSKGILKRVEVIPCESDLVCPLVKGTNVTLDAEFISNISSNQLIGSIYGKMTAFWPIRFGQPEDLCQSKQVECPIIPGKVYHFQTTVFVKHSYPKMKLDTKVLLEGDNHQEIACALIPVEIVSASSLH